MAYIHHVGLSPTKLELLAPWLPTQDWYAGNGKPELTRVGGFRLDDPAGEVGIEFMFVRDDAGGAATAYQVPMTYRGAPLPGADDALIGTGEHGALGTRWIYDGVRDPVLVAQLVALLRGEVEPQHQSESDTVEPRARVARSETAPPAGSETVTGPDGLAVHLARVLAVDESPVLLATFGTGTLGWADSL